ncbi:MAG TPA: PAS domain S-box protein [Terriglobales bacterium]
MGIAEFLRILNAALTTLRVEAVLMLRNRIPKFTAKFLRSSAPSCRQIAYALLALAVLAAAPFLIWRDLSKQLLASNFLPHAYCYLQQPGLVWTHVIADSVIAVAYLAISMTLVYLVYRARQHIPFHWVFLAFGLFIIACGGAHLVEAVTIWEPVYVLSAAIKVFTAGASLTTAAVLPFTVPRVLTLVRNARATEAVMLQLRAHEAEKDAMLRELREKKEMFQCLFESAPDALLVSDAHGRIVDLNDQARRLFGYAREELLGSPIEWLVPEESRERHGSGRHAYLQSPEMRSMGQGLELHARRKDGSQCPVDITLSPLPGSGEPRVLAAIRDITEHKLADEKLRESLREKDVLLREVHHRVKNNLAVICSLFYLESTYAKDAHTAQVFRESENRVHSMALVHETLYGSKSFSRIDFAQYAKVLATDILSTYGKQIETNSLIRLKTDLQPVIMSMDLAVPCGLILNELISNAFKHGFPDGKGGEITISLAADRDQSCLLRVDDNGAGLPAGFNLHTRKSLGLRLVRSLTKQIRGSFELVRSEPGSSARVQFSTNHDAH